MRNVIVSTHKTILCWLLIVLAVTSRVPLASAQTVAEPSKRWLLIFDTSFAMKKCLPATDIELKDLFAASFGGELREGDSIGVWTFSDKLRAAHYPLIIWAPQNAADETSKLISFINDQHFSGHTSLKVLSAPLSKIISHSERLTIVIFFDGKDKLKMTPYDDGINQTIQDMQDKMKATDQPLVLVIRTQDGQFIGATVNLPPGSLALPPFAPLAPPAATPADNSSSTTPASPPRPVYNALPLVIVGTNVVTDTNQIIKIQGS